VSGREWPLHVRRARPDDRDAVLRFASTTWDGWDYIPNAWPKWIDATDGALLVACVGRAGDGAIVVDADGQPLAADTPIAVARVALLSPTEAWLEGIRVDPRVRGLGVASDLQVAELRWAAASGARVVRYATGERNEASHRLGARHGFALLRSFRNWHSHQAAPPWDDDNDPEDEAASGFDDAARAEANATRARLLDALAADGLVCAQEDAGRWWERLAADATFRAGEGLCEERGWTVQQLTPALFEAHARAGEVVVTESALGWALAILRRQVEPSEDVDLHLAVVAGDGRAALELVGRIHRGAGRRVRFWLPEPDPPLVRGLEAELVASQFHGRPWQLHILARPLDDDHPLPSPERPDSLILEDEPAPLRPTIG
jgi:GNAT superfamily N-acetyltransferase